MKIRPNGNYKLLGTDIVLDKTKTYDAIVASNQPECKEKGLIFVINIPGKNPDDGFLLERGEYEIVEMEKNCIDLTAYTDRTDANGYISLFDQGAIRNPVTDEVLYPLVAYSGEEIDPNKDGDFDTSGENVTSIFITFDEVKEHLELAGDEYFTFIGMPREHVMRELDNEYLTFHIQALNAYNRAFDIE